MKTKDEILTDILAKAEQEVPTMIWRPKTPQSDVVAVMVDEIWKLHIIKDYLNKIGTFEGMLDILRDSSLQSNLAEALNLTFDETSDLISADIDNRMEMWGFTRSPAIFAKGVIRLIFNSSDAVTIAAGTQLLAQDQNIRYEITEDVNGRDPVLIDGNYVIDVFGVCTTSGTVGNIVENTRFDLVDLTIPNFMYAYSYYDINNGVDEESDSSFVTRARSNRLQHGVGSKSWLYNKILSDPRVYDISIQGLANTNETDPTGRSRFERDYGIDIWVQALETRHIITENFMPDENDCHTFKSLPIVDYDIVQTVDMSLARTESAYDRSTYEVIKVRYSGAGVDPANVVYTVDETIQDLQESVLDPQYWLLGGREQIFIKKAYQVYLDVYVKIHLEGGYTFDDVESDVRSDIFKFIEGGTTSAGVTYTKKKLEETIDKSDLLEVILAVDGVDRADLDSYSMGRHDGKFSTSDPIPTNYNEFFRYNATYTEIVEY